MRACGLRALSNGMVIPTLFPWRPAVVHRRTPLGNSGLCTKQMTEPAMRCIGPGRGRNAVCRCSLPCVGRVNGGTTPRDALARVYVGDRLLKPGLQKRLKKRTDCGGNHLGCSRETEKGLQCGLSGSRVARSGDTAPRRQRGNRLHRQREVRRGEIQPGPKP
mgnify:CR=1 FL=1